MPKPSEIAPYPTQGKYYQIKKKGEFLFRIAGMAYGDTHKWPLIWEASRNLLRSGNPNIPYIGEFVFIPFDQQIKPSLCRSSVRDKRPDDFTLLLGDREVPVTDARVIRTMDTASDGWTATIPWFPGKDKGLDKLVRPFGYPSAGVYLGGELVCCGKLYGVTPKISAGGRSKDLEGFSSTIDLVDSMIKPPYQRSNVTLLQRAQQLAAPHGIKVIVTDGTNIGGLFKRVTAGKTETIFKHLQKLAKERGVLVSSSPEGILLLTSTTEDRSPVASIVEGRDFSLQPLDIGSKFDGRQRFASYLATSGGSRKRKKKKAVANDNTIPSARFFTFEANNLTAAELRRAVDWQKSKQLADSLTIPISVPSWYTPAGTLWRENTIVNMSSVTLDLPDGFDFLIKQVEYVFSNSGRSAATFIDTARCNTVEKKVFEDPWNT